MHDSLRRLPDAELEIMLILWEAGKPVQRSYIDEQLKGKKDWAVSTVLNLLARLIDRGFVAVARQGAGKMNIYSAAVSEQEYLEFESKTMLEKLYGNSLKNFVATLYSGKAIDDRDINELRVFLDEHRKRGTNA
ncbi:Predicted transcriptional regulator [Sporobacter termitidis DSM 10068]|uniref:Predicted transcriptional regulator n=1 Tax=Sporobacter termitidis DSM 10068 TaxID=1123282 RepID=A0A1M5YTL1_9FIRM|nr:BlaI/MecI/CopY family transcriptional regulator [Sporobacter termitidis]SHI14913.1 Predicted transcriptional regulator [Sporobacter termitidis DSM 10068]